MTKLEPFPELTDIPLREQSETSDGYWYKHKLEGRVFFSPKFPKMHPTSHQSPLALKELKIATVAMSLWQQHCNETNEETFANFIELDGSESKFCVKVDACEIFFHNTDISYLPLSGMDYMPMLHLKSKKFFFGKISIGD